MVFAVCHLGYKDALMIQLCRARDWSEARNRESLINLSMIREDTKTVTVIMKETSTRIREDTSFV